MEGKGKKIMVSIRPEYAKMIFEGGKRFEYRKSICQDATAMVIYATAPVSKVVGEVEIKGIEKGSFEELWDRTKHASGIGRSALEKYFEEHGTCYAYSLGKVRKFSSPRPVSSYGLSRAPQSWCSIGDIKDK